MLNTDPQQLLAQMDDIILPSIHSTPLWLQLWPLWLGLIVIICLFFYLLANRQLLNKTYGQQRYKKEAGS